MELVPGIHWDGLEINEYHSLAPTPETHFFSSSQLKLMLTDERAFYRQYISRTEPPEKQASAAMDIGSYIHAALLEPHTIKDTFCLWTGSIRSGKAWEKFQEDNAGKSILNMKDVKNAKALLGEANKNKIFRDFLDDPEARVEVSICYYLYGVPIKVRFDVLRLAVDLSWGLDIKTTSKNAASRSDLKGAIYSYDYRLSAALYMDLANVFIKEAQLPYAPLSAWYWAFLSKSHLNTQIVKATDADLDIGRRQYTLALARYKKHMQAGWVFADEIIEIQPDPWEMSSITK